MSYTEVELLIALLISVLGFYIKRLYSRMDIIEKKIDDNADDLANHKIHDATSYATRGEIDNKLHRVRDDIRGMISPIHSQLQNIEEYLRAAKK